MLEFTIENRAYRTLRMDAFQQLHVARRLLPILAKIPDMIGFGLENIIQEPEAAIAGVAANIGRINLDAIAGTFARLDQADVDYILNACLDSVQIKDSGGPGWAQVRRNGVLMYDHIGMLEMLKIAAYVIKDNLGGFFIENAPTSPAEAGKAAATA